LGAIAPGKRADLVVVDDLRDFHVHQVYKDGMLVAEEGQLLQQVAIEGEIQLRHTVQVGELTTAQLQIPVGRLYRVIQVQPGQILTREVVRPVRMEAGRILDLDVLKIVVVERHRQSGHVGVGLIQGVGLRDGAIASSVAHDSHNLIAVGRDDQSILQALEALIQMQGGIVLTRHGRVEEALPLPIGGLISDRELTWVVERLRRLHQLAHEAGVELTDPFMTLAFMALPVIPEIKITTQGLFDVRQNQLVSLVLE
jgi:adenine deaminase